MQRLERMAKNAFGAKLFHFVAKFSKADFCQHIHYIFVKIRNYHFSRKNINFRAHKFSRAIIFLNFANFEKFAKLNVREISKNDQYRKWMIAIINVGEN